MKEDFVLMYEKYRDSIERYVYYLIQDREISRDITQDVFLKLFIAIKKGNYKDQGFEKKFIYTLAHNESLNFLNRKKNEKIYLKEASLFKPNHTTLCDDLCNRELICNVMKIIEVGKPSVFIKTYKLRIIDGLSYENIAQEMNDNIGTIKGRLNACDKFLVKKGFVIDSKNKRTNKRKLKSRRNKKRIVELV